MSTTGPNTEAEWERYNDMMHDLAQARRDVEAAEKACVDLCAFIGVNGLDFNGPDWMNAILRAKDVVKAVNAARARLAALEQG